MDVQFAYTMTSLNNNKIHFKIFKYHRKNMQNAKEIMPTCIIYIPYPSNYMSADLQSWNLIWKIACILFNLSSTIRKLTHAVIPIIMLSLLHAAFIIIGEYDSAYILENASAAFYFKVFLTIYTYKSLKALSQKHL